MKNLAFHCLLQMKDDYTTNYHCLTYTFLFRKVERMYSSDPRLKTAPGLSVDAFDVPWESMAWGSGGGGGGCSPGKINPAAFPGFLGYTLHNTNVNRKKGGSTGPRESSLDPPQLSTRKHAPTHPGWTPFPVRPDKPHRDFILILSWSLGLTARGDASCTNHRQSSLVTCSHGSRVGALTRRTVILLNQHCITFDRKFAWHQQPTWKCNLTRFLWAQCYRKPLC